MAMVDAFLEDTAGALDSPGDIVLDLTRLTFIDSSGLKAVAELAQRVDGIVVLRCPPPNVLRVLDILGHPHRRLTGHRAQREPAPRASRRLRARSCRGRSGCVSVVERRPPAKRLLDRWLGELHALGGQSPNAHDLESTQGPSRDRKWGASGGTLAVSSDTAASVRGPRP